MDKTIFEVDLQRARKRLEVSEMIRKDLQVKLSYSDKNGLKAMHTASRLHLIRVEKNIAHLNRLISDLEKASGALPLK